METGMSEGDVDKIRAAREARDRGQRDEARRLSPIKQRLQKRATAAAGHDWPVYADTLERAILDPSEVRAPPLPEPTPMANLRRDAESAEADPVESKERSDARTRAFAREKSERDALSGPWTPERVDLWLTEMNAVLMRLPIETRPRGYSSTFRQTVAEFQDVVSQAENRNTRSLRNAVAHRWGSLSMAEVRRSDDSMTWCGRYLRDYPDLAKCVGLGARWKALGAPLKKRCKSVLKMWPSQFFARRKRGLAIIAEGLKRDGVRP